MITQQHIKNVLQQISIYDIYNENMLKQSYKFVTKNPQPNKKKRNIDKFINAKKVNIRFKKSTNDIHYQPINNFINIRPLEYFISTDKYYYSLLHELMHWTGDLTQTGRCSNYIISKQSDKKIKNEFMVIIKEELFAYIGSYLLCEHFNIKFSIDFLMGLLIHACYFNELKNRKKLIESLYDDLKEAFTYLGV